MHVRSLLSSAMGRPTRSAVSVFHCSGMKLRDVRLYESNISPGSDGIIVFSAHSTAPDARSM